MEKTLKNTAVAVITLKQGQTFYVDANAMDNVSEEKNGNVVIGEAWLENGVKISELTFNSSDIYLMYRIEGEQEDFEFDPFDSKVIPLYPSIECIEE